MHLSCGSHNAAGFVCCFSASLQLVLAYYVAFHIIATSRHIACSVHTIHAFKWPKPEVTHRLHGGVEACHSPAPLLLVYSNTVRFRTTQKAPVAVAKLPTRGWSAWRAGCSSKCSFAACPNALFAHGTQYLQRHAFPAASLYCRVFACCIALTGLIAMVRCAIRLAGCKHITICAANGLP